MMLRAITAALLVAFPAAADPPLTRAEPLVRLVLQEANTEPFTGKVAVAGVAIDRAADGRWPAEVREVIYQPEQFTGMGIRLRDYTAENIREAREAVAAALSGERPCGRVLWFHTAGADVRWADGSTPTCRIGEHVFYEELGNEQR